MHEAASAYVADQIQAMALDVPRATVLDLGGRDVNGTARPLFVNIERYVAVDIRAGRGVDIVADAATVRLDEKFDVVVSTELLEHAEHADQIVATAYHHLHPDGVFIATMAGPRRRPHGASGESDPPPGEFYRNVYPQTLDGWLSAAGFDWWHISEQGADIRCVARA